MAFNFNWSPLTADAGFYSRAQDLLTAALNKSPKPPIIVDDVVVTELNLGSVPPELEILEIGDLAEDRFRGIFKMSYSGDAFLTLKTCVQANLLNTYLVTRPAFTSPKPLAAATGLTIPLQITLSNIRLSGFVILVFSKQKGITVVFRNDPLESLKVSSTFDSIPFVRDYLQNEIEGQLRILFMEELPAIIHRLSLRLWVPEYRGRELESTREIDQSNSRPVEDPLLNPPQDPVDSSGKVLSSSEIASLSLDSGVEMHSLFSQKNLLRLAALTDSQRTLSLFTPSIREVVYRAWTGAGEHGDLPSGLLSPRSPALSRTHSHIANSSFYGSDGGQYQAWQTRSILSGSTLSGSGLSVGAGRHSKMHTSRKRKKRVVDLRKRKSEDGTASVSDDNAYTETSSPPSVFSQPSIPEEQYADPVTPPSSPKYTKTLSPRRQNKSTSPTEAGLAGFSLSEGRGDDSAATEVAMPFDSSTGRKDVTSLEMPPEKPNNGDVEISASKPLTGAESDQILTTPQAYYPNMPSIMEAAHTGTMLQHPVMMKMFGEIARRLQEEKSNREDSYSAFWNHNLRDESPPPAYRQ